MKIAIMQPYIFPYAGYFQLVAAVDKFLLLDDVTFINKGWINRNRILINGQPVFFNIPVMGASQNKTINYLSLMPDNKWKVKFEKTVTMSYNKGAGFSVFFPVFQEILYFDTDNLSKYLANSIQRICDFLEIATTIVPSTSIYEKKDLIGQERIIDLCKKENTDIYINAIGGKSLYNAEAFHSQKIQLKFLQPELNSYRQIGVSEFLPGLSIIDMLMNCPKAFVQQQVKQHFLE